MEGGGIEGGGIEGDRAYAVRVFRAAEKSASVWM